MASYKSFDKNELLYNIQESLRELEIEKRYDIVLGKITENGSKKSVCKVSKAALSYCTGKILVPDREEPSDEDEGVAIFFSDVADDTLLLFKDFIFKWELPKTTNLKSICGFLKFAKRNKLKLVQKYILYYLAKRELETPAEHLLALNCLTKVNVKDHPKCHDAIQVVSKEIMHLVQKDVWLEVDQKVIELIASLPQLKISEEKLLDAILVWGLKQCENNVSDIQLRAITRGALKCVRFLAFNGSNALTTIRSCRLLTGEDVIKIDMAIKVQDAEKLPEAFSKSTLPRGLNDPRCVAWVELSTRIQQLDSLLNSTSGSLNFYSTGSDFFFSGIALYTHSATADDVPIRTTLKLLQGDDILIVGTRKTGDTEDGIIFLDQPYKIRANIVYTIFLEYEGSNGVHTKKFVFPDSVLEFKENNVRILFCNLKSIKNLGAVLIQTAID